nr:glucokinase [Candidatus Cloacimonadota bacterium]
MKILNISIDVGGTHSRLQGEILEEGKVIFTSPEYKKIIGNKAQLQQFIDSSLRDFTDLKPTKCVIGFAGAVIDRHHVTITNWIDRPVISLEDLIEWGLPESTFMVNDMELAGYGVLAMKEKNELQSGECTTLFMPRNLSRKYPQNMLIIAPGTGFGTGSIVEMGSTDGKKQYEVISSEVQHVQLPPLDETHAKMIQLILAKKPERAFLNFEDFVSG